MNISSWAVVITAIAACGATFAAVWGLRYAKMQIDSAVNDRRVDRVLALYRDFNSGEIGASRDRFSDLMFRVGEEVLGPGKCWRPDLKSLIPTYPPSKNASRFLGAYPQDMIAGAILHPLNDLRQVLWCFDRINEARKRQSALDEQLLVSLMGIR